MRRLLLTLLWLLVAVPAQAMDIQACSRPVVFRNAAVNALVLPWRADGSTPALREASRQISSLAHLQLLMSMLKYGSVGAIDLVAEQGQVCDVDQVLYLVSRAGVEDGTLARGQAVLVLWGRLFEQDGELFLQTYLRFARQGSQGLEPERLGTFWGGAELQATLPMQALAFAPRRIRLDELSRVDAASREALRVRPTPDMAAPGVEIGRSPSQSFPYWIAESRGDWMRLAPMRQGLPAGWVRARASDERADWQLARWLPELDFADAVAGWLRLQVGVPAAERGRIEHAVEAGLARYEAAVPAYLAPQAWGLSAALRGQMAWARGDKRTASELFARASAQLPAGAAGLNLAAVTALSDYPTAEAAARLQQQLLAALALAPSDTLVRTNLAAVYGVLGQNPSWSSLSGAELAERRRWLLAP